MAAWLVALAIPTRAQAPVVAPCAAYWNAAAVFVGRVEAVKRSGSSRVASFAVLDGFHGVTSSVIDVATTPATRESCPPLKVGREYFVYAQRVEAAGSSAAAALATTLCSLTREVEDAGADLAYARAAKQGNAPAGFISGSVFVFPRTLAGTHAGLAALPPTAITVTVSHDDATDTTVTDRGGFRVASRGAGTYRVSVSVPEHFYSDAPVSTVTLRDPRSCATLTSPFTTTATSPDASSTRPAGPLRG